jgi:membrane-associated phospholipid phosphatase
MRTPRGYASVDVVRVRRLPPQFWVGVGVYVLLTILVAAHALDDLDRTVFHFALRHRHHWLYEAADDLTDVFSPPVDTAILAIGAGALAWRRRRPAIFIAATLSVGAMAAIVLATKAALGRPLPFTRPGHHADAFPSGHTATFLVCFGTLVLLATTRHRSRRGPLLTAVAVGTLLVAAGLVYDGFHWLSDTVGSLAVGTAVLSLLGVGLSRRTASPRPAADTPPTGRTAHPH